ncbi:efflux RND transporter periplasmic adaptor subunit [Lysobacter solisilvae (ex Woo and Kim 2020)]|uniref:Efflux RND transporter periplasmic adaptor subunit n=1 Tax=Agrilutibacter terrestris TaxID=2865112 RepID=A0A7H0FUT0_9GAMM|nr:efflux RND transporter periplasmic adaptor subunit [Lysobacter terrestris]QNP39796.1 efflux RND transporter periplasmic adaptor subunit [Lysobacter terrestris]
MPVSLPSRPHRVLLALGLASLLAACGKGDAEGGKGGKGGQPPATVSTLQVQPVRWSDELKALGTANARESVTITASVSQTIASVEFDSGDYVKQGQPLVTLVQGQQTANVAQAQAQLRNAEQLYERSRKLADQQLIARADLDTQRSALEAARAQVATQRATVADRVIRAPFAGVLGLRLVSAGSLVTPGTPITTLDDVSTIKLDFTFPEAALSQLALGQRVNARSEAWPGETFVGTVASIDSRVDPVSRAVTVRAEIPNADGRLRPGMLLDVGVERAARNTLAIPELALQQNGTVSSVYRVEAGDQVKEVPVKIGSRRFGEVEIVSGLKAGDRIVVEGTVKLRDGAKIKDVGANAATGEAPDAAPQGAGAEGTRPAKGG